MLHDPRYRQAGLTKGAAQQIAQMKSDSSKARQEQRQGEEQYQTALLEKRRQQMEGWDQDVADGGARVTKMRQLGLAWEAVLAPSATGQPPLAKKAAGRVRCLGLTVPHLVVLMYSDALMCLMHSGALMCLMVLMHSDVLMS